MLEILSVWVLQLIKVKGYNSFFKWLLTSLIVAVAVVTLTVHVNNLVFYAQSANFYKLVQHGGCNHKNYYNIVAAKVTTTLNFISFM